jgi:simple sugar transport system permease protein
VKNITVILHSAILISTPLLFAALGGLYTELAGMLNIALEGMLLAGAFTAIAAVSMTGSFTAGICAAIAASGALAFLTAFSAIKLKSNVFISGLAANLLAGGMVTVMSQIFFKTRGVVVLREIKRLPAVNIPLLKNIPYAGKIISGHSLYLYAALLLLLVSFIVIYKTPFGYRLRSSGKNADVLYSLGINYNFYRYAAFIISGICCGIGGSFLSLNLGAYVPNMSAGRGWIALVIILLGMGRPVGVLAGVLIYSLAEAVSNYIQGMANMPLEIVLAIPYIVTLTAIIGSSIIKTHLSTR